MTPIATIVHNAELLAGLERAFPGEWPVYFADCSADAMPEVRFLGRDEAAVRTLFREPLWTPRTNYSRTFRDLVSYACGVRLVILDAIQLPAPKLEGPIHSVGNPEESSTLSYNSGASRRA